MVAWIKNRVVNFSAGFAERYTKVLVQLDGQTYDQPSFFKALVDVGLFKDVPQDGEEQTIAKRRWKRWDSYLGKIREFGLGFAVDETRKGGTTRTIWKASSIAKDFAAGRLNYRQFMALQCMRLQLPKPSMPLQPLAKAELQRGVRIRPLSLIIEALDQLASRGVAVYLSRQEIFRYLTSIEQHDQLNSILDTIIQSRTATINSVETSVEPEIQSGAEEEGTGQASQDIWLNEFEATGYLRQLRPLDGSTLPPHIVVRALPRWEEARLLKSLVPVQLYDTSSVSIDAYFDFLSTSPSFEELRALNSDPDVIQLEVALEVQLDLSKSALIGKVDVVGGLASGALVCFAGDDLDPRAKATIFDVTESTSRPADRVMTARLRPLFVRADHQPIVTGEVE